jgi:hypothetical protein
MKYTENTSRKELEGSETLSFSYFLNHEDSGTKDSIMEATNGVWRYVIEAV